MDVQEEHVETKVGCSVPNMEREDTQQTCVGQDQRTQTSDHIGGTIKSRDNNKVQVAAVAIARSLDQQQAVDDQQTNRHLIDKKLQLLDCWTYLTSN